MFAATNHAVRGNYLLTIMLLDLYGNAQAANWTCGVITRTRCKQRMLFAGQWVVFLERSWSVDGDGFFCERADTKQWQFCLHVAHLPCDIAVLFSVSASLFHPLATLCLSLSSSGLIRAGLWGEGEMVTVTTAENDGQSGRALCVQMCECVIARSYSTVFRWVFHAAFQCTMTSWKLAAAQ